MAPEILKGQHYGPSADIFSFGIVIASTLVSGGKVYSALRAKGIGWQVISHMITAEGYRPVLPNTTPLSMQARLARLAEECWQDNPSDRPTGAVVVAV